MNKSIFKIIWLKAWVAFCIPFFTTLGGVLTPYTTGDVHVSSNIWIRLLIGVIVLSAALVAGFSGLSSFLSTTFAEHKIKQEAGLDDSDPTPQMAYIQVPSLSAK